MKKQVGKIKHPTFKLVVTTQNQSTTLSECPPGVFLFNGDYGFRTEYSDDNGPEAYCLASGEYFWGGTNGDTTLRKNLMVMPCKLNHKKEKS